MDLLDEYKQLLGVPSDFNDALSKKKAIEAAILRLQHQERILKAYIVSNCNHYTVRVSKELDYDNWDYVIECDTCGHSLYCGSIFGYNKYIAQHNCIVVNQL